MPGCSLPSGAGRGIEALGCSNSFPLHQKEKTKWLCCGNSFGFIQVTLLTNPSDVPCSSSPAFPFHPFAPSALDLLPGVFPEHPWEDVQQNKEEALQTDGRRLTLCLRGEKVPYFRNKALMNTVVLSGKTAGTQSALVSPGWPCEGGAEHGAGASAAPKNILRIGLGCLVFQFVCFSVLFCFCFPRISETLAIIHACVRPLVALHRPAQPPRWLIPCRVLQSGLRYGWSF